MSHQPTILAIWREHLRVAALLELIAPEVDAAAKILIDRLLAGARLLACGNGGSAADAQHIAAELTGRFLRDRRPLSALALHANGSSLTAVSNDYGYDHVFAREVQAHGRSGDVLLAISTSGRSKNVLLAMEAARAQGMTVIALTGANGGSSMQMLADVCLCVPSTDTPRIQELHAVVGHTLCELVENAL